MIRDQFQDVKKVTTKEARKKASLGERNYYSKRINKLSDLSKSVGLSLIITTVILGLSFLLVLFVYLISRGTETPYATWKFVIWTSVFGACVLFIVVWYAVLKPRILKKIDFCRHELERLNAKNISKAAATYALYGEAYKKHQEQIHREEKEKVEKIAEQKQSDNSQNSAENQG